MITETAPAKLNLYLHVGSVRRDGLHELSSLFVFTEAGDVVTASPARELSLTIQGLRAGALAGFPAHSNLVMRAARALQSYCGVEAGAALTLDKHLPTAAGVGGGSSDAAAALRALVRLWRVDIGEAALRGLAFRLGADVPACLARRPVVVAGAGEKITPAPALPPFWVCLLNPGVETPTGPVFRAFDAAGGARQALAPPPNGAPGGLGGLKALLAATRNDLEPHAVAMTPLIGAARHMLFSCPGCLTARMSGSGATVFGVFTSLQAAERAARRGAAKNWWSMASRVAVGRDAKQSAGAP